MKKKGRKGKGFGRLFAGPDETARSALRSRPGDGFEPDDDAIETPEDILAKYGKYLDEDGVPLKGINPKPKYYVVPKEVPAEEIPDPRPVRRPEIVHQIKTTPAPGKPEATRAVVRKRAKPSEPVPKKVIVRKRNVPDPEPAPKKVVVQPKPASKKVVVQPKPASKKVVVVQPKTSPKHHHSKK